MGIDHFFHLIDLFEKIGAAVSIKIGTAQKSPEILFYKRLIEL